MAIILKANKVNLFVSSVLFVFWYHSPNVLDTLHTRICNISWLRVNPDMAAIDVCSHDRLVRLRTVVKEFRIHQHYVTERTTNGYGKAVDTGTDSKLVLPSVTQRWSPDGLACPFKLC
jgi:hypothetical protein